MVLGNTYNKLVSVALFPVCLFALLSCGEKEDASGLSAHEKATQERVKKVRIHSLAAEPSQRDVEHVGILFAHRKVNVVSEYGGTIEKLFFERGDKVKKGQILAEISTSRIQIEVAQARAVVSVSESQMIKTEKGSRPEEIGIAEARVEQVRAALHEAENNFKRIKSLHSRNAVSNSDFDTAKKGVDTARASLISAEQELELVRLGPRAEDRRAARAGLQQARAALALARDRLDKSILNAPCNGIVAFRLLEEKEVVGPGTTITQVVDRERMKITLSLGEQYIPILEQGKQFPFRIDAIPGKEFDARLTFVSPTADPVTHSFPLELAVVAMDPRMADGMTVRVAFPLVNPKRTIKVPSAWLAEEKGVIGVFVAQEGRARFRQVQLGAYYAHRVEILRGVEEGDMVITNPSGLKDGDRMEDEGGHSKTH